MSMLTVRGLNEEDKRLLRIRAAENNRSMEAEVRAIIHEAVSTPVQSSQDLTNDWVNQMLELGQSVGGAELEIPPRDLARVPEL